MRTEEKIKRDIKEFLQIHISGVKENIKEKRGFDNEFKYDKGYIKACEMIIHYIKKY